MTTLTTTFPAVCAYNHVLLHTTTSNTELTLCVARTTVVSSCAYNGVPKAALNLPGNHMLSCRSNPSGSVDRFCTETCVAASISPMLRRSALRSARVELGDICDISSMFIPRRVAPFICRQVHARCANRCAGTQRYYAVLTDVFRKSERKQVNPRFNNSCPVSLTDSTSSPLCNSDWISDTYVSAERYRQPGVSVLEG